MSSIKEALVAREISARRVESTIFYMDLRAQGKGYEGYLEQARDHGVGLVRSRVNAVTPQPQGLLQVTTGRRGVLVCGAAREPMDIPESVTPASAAAAVASLLMTTAI